MPSNNNTFPNNSLIACLAIIAILSAISLYFIGSNLVVTGLSAAFDNNVSTHIQFLATPLLTTFFLVITWFGSGYVIGIFLPFFFGLLIYLKKVKEAIFFAGATIGGEILIEVVKLHFHRLRPPIGRRIIIEHGYSFPSGHSGLSLCLYGSLMIIIWQQAWPLSVRLIACTCLMTLIALIWLSRIYLGAHYPTDVLGGILVGICCLSVGGIYLSQASAKRSN